MAMAVKVFLCSFLFVSLVSANVGELSLDFYRQTCPSLEEIVAKATAKIILASPKLVAALLRMQFHDCFVRGCDGSVLIESTAGNVAEKDAFPNLSLRGFQEIQSVKDAVENACPGVVSCADILALVARDAVLLINGPFWRVALGRRDGTVSMANDALANLPPPFSNSSQLISSFASKGLDAKDLVVLSGAHTIGISHCSSFSNRIYPRESQDPELDPLYASLLRVLCPEYLETNTVPMDPISPEKFDISYYNLVLNHKGLFQSDAALLNDPITKGYVLANSGAGKSSFFDDFGEAMEKMIKIGVLTGAQGEIRRICSKVN